MLRRTSFRTAAFLAALTSAVVLVLMAASAWAMPAKPPVAPKKVPILIVDGGLGDGRFYATHWLGQADDVAQSVGARLLTSSAPRWWSGADAPDTYLLTPNSADGSFVPGALTARDIAWALDQVARRHAVGKAVVVAQGASGLAARAYLEDLATPKQSARADVVGLVMLGTPSMGLSLSVAYPQLDIWAPYAAGAGLTAPDLVPDSPFISSLNARTLPGVVKVLAVQGIAATLGGQDSDGVATSAEQLPPPAVVPGPIDKLVVRARASEAWDLGKTWLPLTKKGGAGVDRVGDAEVERLGLTRGYVTLPDVQTATRTFYTTWFSGPVPITHISSRLVVDASGSMNTGLGRTPLPTKLQAARQAAGAFADSLAARKALPPAVPEDIGLITFNTAVAVPAPPSGDPAAVKAALGGIRAEHDTDVGKALQAAVDSFQGSPPAADKVVVFLSDGVNTVGDKSAILSGPVAQAAREGIRIDTIAMGGTVPAGSASGPGDGMGQADLDLLRKVAADTKGSFHQAEDLFGLRRDFLRARYASLGPLTIDKQIALKTSPSRIEIGSLSADARLVEIGVVSDGEVSWRLLRDNQPVAKEEIQAATLSDGTLALAVSGPKPGVYALEVQGKNGTNAHAFVVMQQNAFRVQGRGAPPNDNAGLWLVAVAILGAAAIVATIVLGTARRRPDAGGTGPAPTAGPAAALFGDPSAQAGAVNQDTPSPGSEGGA